MRKILKLSAIALSISLIAACSQASKIDKPYIEMSEAEQAVTIENIAEQFDSQNSQTNSQNMTTSKGTRIIMHHYGDAKTDMIYLVGTYSENVPDKILKKAMSKFKALNLCADPEIINLNQHGLGYQVSMKDLSGKLLYESEACTAAKA